MSQSSPQEPAALPVAPRCYRHPDRETYIRCIRCDRPICPECMHPAAVGFQCPDDVAQGRRTVRQKRTSVGALLRQSPPYVTFTLLVANVAIYLYTALRSPTGMTHPYASNLFQNWELVPHDVRWDDEYYRLITSAFLHISLLHIASNMFALFIVGPPLERLLGPVRFGAVYLLSALGGSAAVYAFGVDIQPVAGASGAIFGLFGGYLILGRRVGADMQMVIGTIVLNFVLTFSISGISKLGHIGGFVVGLLACSAIGGLPRYPLRIPNRMQAAGLGGVAVLVAVVVGVRTLTW
jgi:membrane associated rhomboid family serine protease